MRQALCSPGVSPHRLNAGNYPPTLGEKIIKVNPDVGNVCESFLKVNAFLSGQAGSAQVHQAIVVTVLK